ncbi:MAG: hypothetical protein HFACDABA_01693 [Anaerolineales bacterium]|nr:hypothetical protein [Anaerolineales bacterium]
MNATSSPNARRGGFYQRFIVAHPSIQSPHERRAAELIAALSLPFAILTFFAATTSAPLYGLFSLLNFTTLVFSAASFAAYLFSRSRAYRRALAPLLGGFTLLAYVSATFSSASALFIVIPFAVLFLLANLLELKAMLIFIAANFAAALVIIITIASPAQKSDDPIAIAGLFMIGLFAALFAWYRTSIERLRLEEAKRDHEELQRSHDELLHAQRDAIQRLSELQVAAEVGRSVSQVRALEVMLAEAVELIRKQFDLYYVQVYLVNPARTQLVLQAGTGSVGAELAGRGYSLPLDSASINGRAAADKKSVIITDTASSASFRPNSLLPATRSEIAVPLMLGENVIGVLDMQSERIGELNEKELPAFETLAGQLAVAIQNANLLAESQQARAEVEKQTARLTRENWMEYLDAIHKPETIGFQFEKNQIVPLGQAQIEAAQENALAAPISVAGEALGSLVVELEPEDQNPQNTELINAVARQVSQQIESLRLLESAERYRLEAEEASRRLTREDWSGYLKSTGQTSLRYHYDTQKVVSESPAWLENAEVFPIEIRGEKLGALSVPGKENLSDHERNLMESTARRLSEHLESLRLTEQTRERAMREQALRQITSAVRGSTDPSVILRTAVRELGEILGRKAAVQLITTKADDTGGAASAESANETGGSQ